MEESITAVDTHPPQPVENLPVAIPPPAQISTFTKVDNNLTSIGFFTASSKRSRKEIEKTTVVVDQGKERKISILPSAKYGLPITQDQDYWLALMKLVTEHLQQEEKLTNPFTFTTADILKILGHQLHNGKNYKAVQEWADVMSFTGIKGGAYDVVHKRWIVDRTHAVERFVTVGKELPDGTIADKNHIWFSQWQLDNINSGNLIAVELTTYTQLENNISKNLVPHLQEWLYASQRDGRFEKQYEDICQLLGVRTYRYRSQIEEQFSPSLNELTTHGYISKWAIEPMAFKKHFKLVLWHGRKYHADRQARMSKNPRQEILTAGESTPAPRPRQRHLNLKPTPEAEQTPSPIIIDYSVVAALEKRGVGTADARKLLATLKPGQPILDQLEYGDLQIEQSRGKITNPPGFYISLLQRDVPVPATFETSRTRNARLAAEKEQLQALADRQAANLAQEETERQKLDAQIAALPEADRLALLQQAKAELLGQHPNMAMFFKTHPDSAFEDGSVKVRMRNLLDQGWKPAQTIPQPENPHYATNPDIRQATPLQETAPMQTVADQPKPVTPPAADTWDTPFSTHLNLVLSTLQLSAPLATTTVVEQWNRPLDTRKN